MTFAPASGRALITGGASGIGRAVASLLTAAGSRVVIADLAEDAGRATAAELGTHFEPVDVTDPASVDALVRRAEEQLGGLDFVHLNAGITTGITDLASFDLAAYRRIVGVNLDGVAFGIRSALPALRRAGGGSIVATASLAGLTAYPMDPLYNATKHAVVGLIRALTPLQAEGIVVNCVCPGFVDTPLIARHRSMFEEAGFPLLTAENVAAAVLAAATSDSTGQAWIVQPGRDPMPYAFRGVPGPRVSGAEGKAPPGAD